MLDTIENRKATFTRIVIVKGMVILIVILGPMLAATVNVALMTALTTMPGGRVFVSGVSFTYISLSALLAKTLARRLLSISLINGLRIIGWRTRARLPNTLRLVTKVTTFNVNVRNRSTLTTNFLKQPKEAYSRSRWDVSNEVPYFSGP